MKCRLLVQMFYRVSEYSGRILRCLGKYVHGVSVMGITDSSLPKYVADLMACMGGNRLKPKQSSL